MANVIYNRGKFRLGTGATDWSTATIRVMLLSVAPAGCSDPDQNTVADVLGVATAAEMSGTNYSRLTITAIAPAEDDANDRVVYDANDALWTAIDAGTAAAAVVFDEGGGADATRYVLAYHDTGFPKATNGGDLTLAWNAAGVITAT